jgi:transposase
MSGTRGRNGDREHFWRQAIADWKKSGQSVQAFCNKLGVSQPSFYAWRRDFAQRDEQRPAATPVFVPLRVVADTVLEVVLPTGVTVRVPAGSDGAAVAKLVAALGKASC